MKDIFEITSEPILTELSDKRHGSARKQFRYYGSIMRNNCKEKGIKMGKLYKINERITIKIETIEDSIFIGLKHIRVAFILNEEELIVVVGSYYDDVFEDYIYVKTLERLVDEVDFILPKEEFQYFERFIYTNKHIMKGENNG